MATREILSLDESTPQILAPQTGDTYLAPRTVTIQPEANTSGLVVSSGTLTADAPALDLTQTWNNSGVTFTGLKFNATDTASASGSLLMDLQVGGASKFSVKKNAVVTGSYFINTSLTGVEYFHGANLYASISLSLKSDAKMGWSATTPGGAMDVTLFRDDANILAQRNGNNAQEFRLYGTTDGTTTEGSNYRRLAFTSTTAGAFALEAEGLGSGVSGNSLAFKTDGTPRLTIEATGNIIVANSLQIGASANQKISASGNNLDLFAAGGNYFRLSQATWTFNLWAGGTTGNFIKTVSQAGNTDRNGDPITIDVAGGSGSGSGGFFAVKTAPSIASGTTGHTSEESFRVRTASSGVYIASFGGSTSSFPALKRNATGLDVRLADDSAYAPLSLGRTLTGTDTDPALFVQGDWATTGAATLIKANVATDTGPSNSASLLMDLQVGGTSKFKVDKDSIVTMTSSSAWGSAAFKSSNNYFKFVTGATHSVEINSSELFLANGAFLSFGPANSRNLILARDDANILAQRNGDNGQIFRIYGRGGGTANYERAYIDAPTTAGAAVKIGTEKDGLGSARALELQTDGTTRLTIAASTHDVSFAAGSAVLTWAGRVSLVAPATDKLGLRSAGGGAPTNFIFDFGGTTSSFPALKRSSTSLIVRLADDSANAPLESASLKTDAPTGGTAATWKLGTVASVTPTSPDRTIEVDIGGTIYYLHAKTTND